MASHIKGVVWAKMVKMIKFMFFAKKKVSSGMGASHPKFLRGLAALEPPPKWREKGGRLENEIKNEKENILYIL